VEEFLEKQRVEASAVVSSAVFDLSCLAAEKEGQQLLQQPEHRDIQTIWMRIPPHIATTATQSLQQN